VTSKTLLDAKLHKISCLFCLFHFSIAPSIDENERFSTSQQVRGKPFPKGWGMREPQSALMSTDYVLAKDEDESLKLGGDRVTFLRLLTVI